MKVSDLLQIIPQKNGTERAAENSSLPFFDVAADELYSGSQDLYQAAAAYHIFQFHIL